MVSPFTLLSSTSPSSLQTLDFLPSFNKKLVVALVNLSEDVAQIRDLLPRLLRLAAINRHPLIISQKGEKSGSVHTFVIKQMKDLVQPLLRMQSTECDIDV